jgi:hypothetical protein
MFDFYASFYLYLGWDSIKKVDRFRINRIGTHDMHQSDPILDILFNLDGMNSKQVLIIVS